MSKIDEVTYAPLDPAALEHQKQLQRSHHCARPVLYAGKRQYINTLTEYKSGGSIEMVVYLEGSPAAIDSRLITVEKSL